MRSRGARCFLEAPQCVLDAPDAFSKREKLPREHARPPDEVLLRELVEILSGGEIPELGDGVQSQMLAISYGAMARFTLKCCLGVAW